MPSQKTFISVRWTEHLELLIGLIFLYCLLLLRIIQSIKAKKSSRHQNQFWLDSWASLKPDSKACRYADGSKPMLAILLYVRESGLRWSACSGFAFAADEPKNWLISTTEACNPQAQAKSQWPTHTSNMQPLRVSSLCWTEQARSAAIDLKKAENNHESAGQGRYCNRS